MEIVNSTKALTFWSWNGNMEQEEVVSQLRQFAAADIGVVIHARAGLSIKYMSEKWFEIFGVALREAKNLGVEVYIYDEDGWPSGFAGGLVTDLGEEHYIKNLQFSHEKKKSENNFIAAWRKINNEYIMIPFDESNDNDLFCYYSVDKNYVDLLSEKTVKQFIRFTHERYKDAFGDFFGNTVKGFFTDEPQLRTFPWSLSIEENWRKIYKSELCEELYLLNYNTKKAKRFKYKYRRLVSDVFYHSFTKQISDWCAKNNLIMTGHFAVEDGLYDQMSANGGVMRHYEAMQMPGIDHLGNRFASPVLCKQVSSVANQFGRTDVLSETFGCSGWNISFKELYSIWGRQVALGLTKPCFHLSAYSIAGRRKRDYPAFFSYQEPWWANFSDFVKRINNLDSVVKVGESDANVLVISPLFSVAANHGSNKGKFYSCQYRVLIENLLDINVCFEVGDENIIEGYGNVRGKYFQVKNRKYDCVIIAQTESLCNKTAALLKEFSQNGGVVWSVGDNPELIDFEYDADLNFPVLQNRRDLIEKWFIKTNMYRPLTIFHTDNDAKKHGAIINSRKTESGKILHIWTGKDFCGGKSLLKIEGVSKDSFVTLFDTYTKRQNPVKTFIFEDKLCTVMNLYPDQNTVLIVDESDNRGRPIEQEPVLTEYIAPRSVSLSDSNSLTLDRASLSINDGNYSEETYLIDLIDEIYRQRGAFDKEKDMPIKLRYVFYTKHIPQNLAVAIEDEFVDEILINGNKISKGERKGFFVDKCINEYLIAPYAVLGKNEIVLAYTISSDGKTLLADEVYETEKNRFFFRIEPDSIYLRGNFSVVPEKEYAYSPYCDSASGPFMVDEPHKLTTGDLTHNGYWFYRGNVEYDFIYNIQDISSNYSLSLSDVSCTAAVVTLNKHSFFICDLKEQIDISSAIHMGINEISVKLLGTNRNLLGPHHHIKGVTKLVGPSTFSGNCGFEDFVYPDINSSSTRIDKYFFIRFGLGKIVITKHNFK